MPSHVLDMIPSSSIVAIRDRLLEMQARGQPVIRMESGDPSFSMPDHIREAIEKALRDGHTHYVASTGVPKLREAAWHKLRQENKIPVRDPGHVLITNGGMHGLYIAFRSLCAPGDQVIVPDPTWPETVEHIRLAQAVPVPCPLDFKRGGYYDPDRIAALVNSQTRAIVINTPHNPTGTIVAPSVLARILEIAEQNDLYVISDEAYEHIVFDDQRHVSIGSLAGAGERVISVYSFSKSYAMSGLRLGYVATNDLNLKERMAKMIRCTCNGINAALQYGGVAALQGPSDSISQMRAEYEKRRDLLWQGLKSLPIFEVMKPVGAFYLWARISPEWSGYNGKNDSWAMTNFLIDRGAIGSSPGICFGATGEHWLRFSFSCATEQVIQAVQKINNLFLWERWQE